MVVLVLFHCCPSWEKGFKALCHPPLSLPPLSTAHCYAIHANVRYSNDTIATSKAVFHKKGLTEEQFEAAPPIWGPVQLFDACPTCDGAAAVVLTSNPDLARQGDGAVIRVAGYAIECACFLLR